MKTTIVCILLGMFSYSSIAQNRNTIHAKFNVNSISESSDSLIFYFEDYLGRENASTRKRFESMYGEESSKLYFLNREKEVRKMLELFGDTVYSEDFKFKHGIDHPLSHALRRYIDSWVGDYSRDFYEWTPYIERHQARKDSSINSYPYILSQLWDNRSMRLQSNGYIYRINIPKEDGNYIPELHEYMMDIDSNGNIYVADLDHIIYKIRSVPPSEQYHYLAYVDLLYNLTATNQNWRNVPAHQILQIATEVSNKVVDLKLHPKITEDVLLAVNKLLITNVDVSYHQLIAQNFGNLYSLLVDNEDKFNLVRLMEIEYLNRLAGLFPYQNLINLESFRIFEELLSETGLNDLPIEFLLAAAEFNKNDLIIRLKHLEPEESGFVQMMFSWRIVLIIEEIREKEISGEFIPEYVYERLSEILLNYYALYNNTDQIINLHLHNLKDQKVTSQYLEYALKMLTQALWLSEQNVNSEKWIACFPSENFTALQRELVSGMNLDIVEPFSSRSDEHKEAFIQFFESWLLFYPDEEKFDILKEIQSFYIPTSAEAKKQGEELHEAASYCYRKQKYQLAYLLEKVADQYIRNEEDLSVLANFVQTRNTNEFKSSKRKLEQEKAELESEKQNLSLVIEHLSSEVDNQRQRLRNLQDENLALEKERDTLNEDIAQKEQDILAKETLLLAKDSVLQQRENEIAEAEDRKRELEADYGDLQTVTNQLQFTLIGIGMLFIVVVIFWIRSIRQRKLIEEQKTLVEIEKDNVVQEQKKTKALQLSIGQMTHLCKDGVNHLLSKFFNSNDPIKLEQGKQALEALGHAFQKFRENKEIFTQSIREEIAFSDTICQFQNPGFSMKYAPSKLAIYNRLTLSNRKVPIYTLVNLMSNVIRHSKLNDDLSVRITEINEHNKPALIVESRADLLPSDPNKEKTGMQYVESMIELTVDGRSSDFTHGVSPDGQGYRSVLPVNK